MIGTTISHYRIEKPLGAGGMGTVYLARDLALGRTAAMKLLPDQPDAALRSRLLREADACAQLQHPGIATFYEAGEDDGRLFIAMEYVDGQTLRQKLAHGRLALPDALGIVTTVLEALGHAHAAGIIHRDVKPENIMLTSGGLAKLLDFGLAKHVLSLDVAPPTQTNLTADHAILGTLGYMAPEQINGQPLDAQTDVFAVGAVLYELLSGQPAFPGKTPTERILSVLTRDPVPLPADTVPPAISNALSRALARDRTARYASAAEMLGDLQNPGDDVVRTALPDTLAIVDFQNLSKDSTDAWLGSGMAESLTTDLSRVDGLRVVGREQLLRARAAVERLEGADDAVGIAQRLGCRWVLSGSFQKIGATVRLTARLTEVATGRVVMAEKVDGSLESIFQMQDRLSSLAARALNLEVPADQSRPQTPQLSAYESYARGLRLWQRLEKGSMSHALELFERAVDRDPVYASALSGIAAAHAMRFPFTTDPAELDAATDYARRAIEAAPDLADPHVWLGYALWRQGRIDDALDEMRRAIELDGRIGWAPYFAGGILLGAGRFEKALEMLQHAAVLDPDHGFVWLALGSTHLEMDRLGEALWSFRKAVEVENTPTPGRRPSVGARAFVGETLRRMGRLDEARRECLAALDHIEQTDHMYRDTQRGVALCYLGRTTLLQDDRPAAEAAFNQALAHFRGRPQALGGGHLVVQAQAGLVRASGSSELFDTALRLFEKRDAFNFSYVYGCSAGETLLELAAAALTLGRRDDAALCVAAAQQAGCSAGRVQEVAGRLTRP